MELKPPRKFLYKKKQERRRLKSKDDEEEHHAYDFVSFVYRTVVGPADSAFQPNPVASCDCYRQVETSIHEGELEEDNDLPFCGPAHESFIVSMVNTTSDATFNDILHCDTDELMALGEVAVMPEESTGQQRTTEQKEERCTESAIKFNESVGKKALEDQDICSSDNGSKSIKEAYKTVDDSIFVIDGVAKPLLHVPGLVQTHLENRELQTLPSGELSLESVQLLKG